MKRCIICGNVDDDNSTVCSMCGNPYVDMGGRASDVDGESAGQLGTDGQKEAVAEEIEEALQKAEAGASQEAQQAEAEQAETEASQEVEQAGAQQAEAEAEALQEAEQAEAEQVEAEAEASQEAQQAEAEASQEAQQAEAEAEASQEAEQDGAQQPEAEAQDAVQELPEAGEAPESTDGPAPDVQPRSARGGSGRMATPASMPAGRPPRRTRSGPQIYGQTEGMDRSPERYSDQGMIRRNMQPRPAAGGDRPSGQMPGAPVRPGGQMPGGANRPGGQTPGAPVRPGAQMQGGTGRPPRQMQGGAGRPSGQDFLARHRMEIARKAMKSPFFLLIVLLHTVYLASSIASIFMGELNYSQAVRLLNDVSLPQQMSGYVGTVTKLLQNLDSGMIVQNILLHVPSMLFCIGLWVIFFTALTAKDRMSGVGFGLAKAGIIIRMIAACIVMLVALVVTVTVVVAAWVGKEKPVIIMAIVMLLITIIVVMMVIMYYFSYLGMLKTCRVNGNTGESCGMLSAYLAVLLIILALPGIIGLLSGIVNMEISNIVGSIAKMGWMIFLAVWIFLYRGKMSRLED